MLLLAAALLAWAPCGVAGAPDWLRAAARIAVPNYPEDVDAVILFDEQVTTVKDNGDILTEYRRAYKILRPKGREFGTVIVFFDSETRLTFLKGWTVPAQGEEYEVKEKDAVEGSRWGVALYEDTRYKLLNLPAAEPGNVVGYEYEQKRRPMILQDIWSFQEEIPVERARFTLRLPEGWEFEEYWLNHPEQKARPLGGNQWTWELEKIPAVEPEPAMPDWRVVAGRLAVTFHPRPGGPTGKTHASWDDVGKWYTGLVGGRREATPEIQLKVTELTANAPTLLDKIKALAAFAQREVRYVAIEIGIGGYQPHAAAEIFNNRYGDCKDKVTLLSAMLREIGVESFYVLVHTRRDVVSPGFPTALTFNHAILAIRLPDEVSTGNLYAVQKHEKLGNLLFFDPTDSLTPLGRLPSNEQANYVLLVTEDGGELVRLDLASPNLNRLLRSAKMALTPDGTLQGAVHEIRWGAPAASLRAQLMDAPEAERTKVLEAFLANFLGSVVFQGAQLEGLDQIDQALVVSYRFMAKNYAKSAGSLLLVRPRIMGQKSTDMLERDEKVRKHPVEFSSASLDSDLFEITLPPGYEVDELPLPVEADCGVASYRSEIKAEGRTLHYRRNYTIKDVRVPRERLADLKTFYRQIAADERSTAVLKVAAPPAALPPATDRPQTPASNP